MNDVQIVFGSNRKIYTSKGYIFTDFGDIFNVNAMDLSQGSHAIVDVKCDYCGKIQSMQYSTYFNQHSKELGDACKDCAYKKQQATMFFKYGESNPSLVKEFQDKRKKTFVEHFGCENPSQNEDVKAKRIETFIKNYGETSPMKNKKVQEKAKQTCLKDMV